MSDKLLLKAKRVAGWFAHNQRHELRHYMLEEFRHVVDNALDYAQNPSLYNDSKHYRACVEILFDYMVHDLRISL